MEQDFDFAWRFPLFAITERPATGRDDSVPQLITASVDDLRDALLLFTDEDLAQRFIDAKGGAAAYMPVALQDGDTLMQTLADMKANGLSTVVVDLSKLGGSRAAKCNVTTVDRVIEAVKNASPG
jgi:hypothetical protein